MRVGDLVRFREYDNEPDYRIGLLIRYDSFTKVAEILVDGYMFYAPARLVQVHRRGKK
tara:strand:- start:806 stop:979 length:174 start_codon:yes stop_codon:yes gene_type:complete